MASPVGVRTRYVAFEGLENEEQCSKYLAALRETGAYISAAEVINCNPREIADYRKREPEFAEMCKAMLEHFGAAIVAVARERVMNGWENPVVGGRNRDEIVAHTKHYSDSLTLAFLKKVDPDFRDKSEVKVEATGSINTFDYSKYSRRVRDQLRLLAQMIKEDEEAVARGEKLEM
jgi:hypothetical protein